MIEHDEEQAAPRVGRCMRLRVVRLEEGRRTSQRDQIAAEEPLEIRIEAGDERRTLAVTMRTPGADFELVAGFLLAEGIISERADILQMSYCVDDDQRYNIVTVTLRRTELPDLAELDRYFVSSSACGVCGRSSVEALRRRVAPLAAGPQVPADVLYALPDLLRSGQGVFHVTGGLHAAALFDAARPGEVLAVREDIGRHNAVDKLIGWALLNGRVPLSSAIMLVSGRASFEIVQKCAVAGVPILCAISAPSSLAVTTARDVGMTLVGFLRDRRCNIYSGGDRIV